MAPTPEQAQQLMHHLADLQAEYAGGGYGLPSGQEWVDWAMQYLEQEEAQNPSVYDSRESVVAALDQWQLLRMPPPPPPSFEEGCDLPDWWASFREFAAKEFATENVDFFDAVRYQTMDTPTIYEQFVRTGSPNEINISMPQRGALDAAFADGAAPGYDVFEAAMKEVTKMLKDGTWMRFAAASGA